MVRIYASFVGPEFAAIVVEKGNLPEHSSIDCCSIGEFEIALYKREIVQDLIGGNAKTKQELDTLLAEWHGLGFVEEPIVLLGFLGKHGLLAQWGPPAAVEPLIRNDVIEHGNFRLALDIRRHDQLNEYHLVEGWFLEPGARIRELKVAPIGGPVCNPMVGMAFKERPDLAEAYSLHPNDVARAGFLAVWRAEPDNRDRAWVLEFVANLSGGREKTFRFIVRCSSDHRDISRDLVRTLVDDWIIDPKDESLICQAISGMRSNYARTIEYQTQTIEFGDPRPVKNTVFIMLHQSTSAFRANLFNSEILYGDIDTELVVFVSSRQAWTELMNQTVSRLRNTPNPIYFVVCSKNVPMTIALDQCVRQARGESVLLLPREFAWPRLTPLFETFHRKKVSAALIESQDQIEQPESIQLRSSLENILFQRRAMFADLKRSPILVARNVLQDTLQKMPVFIRDDLVFESLRVLLANEPSEAITLPDCVIAEDVPQSNRIDKIINRIVALSLPLKPSLANRESEGTKQFPPSGALPGQNNTKDAIEAESTIQTNWMEHPV
jgi:hypothetical protein